MLNKDIKKIIDYYYINNPTEKSKTYFNSLFSYKKSIISRKNFFGHITASAILINQSFSKVLLINHKSLKKFIQPGGHIEKKDKTFSQAAIRELKEETGFVNILAFPFNIDLPEVPFDIDVHTIPENKNKKEAEHLHFDLRYIFILLDDKQEKVNKNELTDMVWVPIKDLKNTPDLMRGLQKFNNVISKRKDEVFFKRIKNKFLNIENIDIVMVSHIVLDILPFIKILSTISKNLRVIPKPNSISSEVLSSIDKKFIYSLNRKQLRQEKNLNKVFPPNRKSLLIDIGGYFATKEFFHFNKEKKRVIGIVEDTENGFIKYKSLDKLINLPIFSVARSKLKKNEDDLVGYSIAYYAEMIMRKKRLLPRYLTVGIIGYGKLGKGIAKYLFNQNIKPIVYDIDSIKMVEAYKDGCILRDKKSLISNCHLIFCATGSVAILEDEFEIIYPGSYIASVTSSEDEFNIKNIPKNIKKVFEDKFITKFKNKHTHFYLINNGNAVNFIDRDGDRVGDFIRLVQAEIMLALSLLVKNNQKPKLTEVSDNKLKKIAQIFIENYLK